MQPNKVKPLDLSNLIRHAFLTGRGVSGQISAVDQEAWSEYDPTELGCYKRIDAALTAQPAEAGVTVKALQDAWTSFCDVNPDDLTSPEDLPDHALMTCQQFVDYALSALVPTPAPQGMETADIEDQAWNCDQWPSWLHSIVDRTNEVADRLDMSSEQAHAYAALTAAYPHMAGVVPDGCMWAKKPCTCGGGNCEQADFGAGEPS